MVLCIAFSEKRKDVQLHRAVPVEQFRIGMVFFQSLPLNRVRAYHLSHEIIVSHLVLGIHQRRGGIGFDSILEHAPVGIITINHTGCHIRSNREQPVFGCVHHGSAGAVFLTVRAQVDTMGFAIIRTDTVVALGATTTECQRMLHSCSSAGGLIKPVDVSTKVHTRVTPAQPHIAVLLCIHHLQLFIDEIPRHLTGVGSVCLAVLASFLGGHHNDTVRTACTVNGRGGTILQHVKRCDIVGVDVGEVSSRHTINHNERTQTGRARRDTTNLNAGLIVGIATACIRDRHTGHLALYHH